MSCTLFALRGTGIPIDTNKHHPRYSVGVCVPIVLVSILKSASFLKASPIAKRYVFINSNSTRLLYMMQKYEKFLIKE